MHALIFAHSVLFLSTLSLRRATARRRGHWRDPAISIHALLAESDGFEVDGLLRVRISIHALLAESDAQLFERSL